MPKKNQQYWLNKWDALDGSNEEKVKKLLQLYIDKGKTIKASANNLSHTLFNTVADFKYVQKVKETLDSLESIEHPLEFIMATLKSIMNTFLPYNVEYYHQGITLKTNTLYVEFEGTTLKYYVIAPYNYITTKHEAIISLSDLGIHHPVNSIADLTPYLDNLFNITSARNHTRSGFIKHEDALYHLLQVVQLVTGINYEALEYKIVLERYLQLGFPKDISAQSTWKVQGLLDEPLQEPKNLLKHQKVFTNADKNKRISSINVQIYMNDKIALSITTENSNINDQYMTALHKANYAVFSTCYLYSRKFKTPLKFNLPAFCYIFDKDNYQDTLLYIDENGVQTNLKINNMDAFINTFPEINKHEINWSLTHQQLSNLMAHLHKHSIENTIFLTRNASNSYTTYHMDISNGHFLERLIQILNHIDPSTKICLDIIKKDIQALKQMNEDNCIRQKIEQVIDAQNKAYYEPIWQLANDAYEQWLKTKTDHSLTLAYEIFAMITQKNYRYAAAQHYLESLTPLQQEAQQYTILEDTFITALKKEEDQSLIDHLYFQLCKHPDETHKITNIRGEPDVLVQLARQLREKNTTRLKSALHHTFFPPVQDHNYKPTHVKHVSFATT